MAMMRDIQTSNSHTLYFRNTHGLTEEQIKKIFASFGDVTVRITDDLFGYHFIDCQKRCRMMECVKKMQGHPMILLKQCSNEGDTSETRLLSPNKATSLVKDKLFENNFVQIIETEQNVPTNGKNLNSNRPLPLISTSDEHNSPKKYVAKHRKIRAHGVIVANIPKSMDTDSILRLFRNFCPIYVSEIERIPDINIRYCYVYFTTRLDADKTVKQFDGLIVVDSELIVLHCDQLKA